MRRWQATRLYWEGMIEFLASSTWHALMFDAQQVIHPNQVVTVNSSFVPTFHGASTSYLEFRLLMTVSDVMSIGNAEILRAAKILHRMNIAYSNQKGAFGLEMEGGGKEMIDAPMLKQVCVSLCGQAGSRLKVGGMQAENVIRLARAAGCDIPHVE